MPERRMCRCMLGASDLVHDLSYLHTRAWEEKPIELDTHTLDRIKMTLDDMGVERCLSKNIIESIRTEVVSGVKKSKEKDYERSRLAFDRAWDVVDKELKRCSGYGA